MRRQRKRKKKKQQQQQQERGRKKKRWKKGGWAKKGEKLEQTKRADCAAATYLDAALQKQERPTRQLGNDPAL